MAGRYRLERLIGEGGMGSVWLATHNVTAKRVALKVLKGDVHTPELRRRFIREATAACAVEHPHVVEVHDVLELDDGAPVMVMEYLEGESLAERLERVEKLPVREVAGILLRVASAVGEGSVCVQLVHKVLQE